MHGGADFLRRAIVSPAQLGDDVVDCRPRLDERPNVRRASAQAEITTRLGIDDQNLIAEIAAVEVGGRNAIRLGVCHNIARSTPKTRISRTASPRNTRP